MKMLHPVKHVVVVNAMKTTFLPAYDVTVWGNQKS